MSGSQAVGGPQAPLTAELLDAAARQLFKEYDERYGGFGGAPKFPPHMNLLFLLRHHQRTGDKQALEMARHTGEAMARGGMYDQLAGGFARYSVDATWTVPHFEKMLYDNALLLRVYTHLWRLTGDPLAARTGRGEIAAFLLRDLGTPEGGLASALDADTDGVGGPDVRLDAGPAERGAGGRRRRVGRRPVRRHRARHLRARIRACCGSRATSTTPTRPYRSAGHAYGRGCCGPGPHGRSRRATTRWSPPGTGWPSPRSPSTRC